MISLYAYDKYRSVAGWKKFNRILDCFVYILGFLQFWMALRLLDANIKAFQLFFAYSFSIIVNESQEFRIARNCFFSGSSHLHSSKQRRFIERTSIDNQREAEKGRFKTNTAA